MCVVLLYDVVCGWCVTFVADSCLLVVVVSVVLLVCWWCYCVMCGVVVACCVVVGRVSGLVLLVVRLLMLLRAVLALFVRCRLWLFDVVASCLDLLFRVVRGVFDV